MKSFIYLSIFLCSVYSCQSQNDKVGGMGIVVGGPCEGCEAIYEYGDKSLTSTDTLPGFHNTSPQVKITGTVYENDGHTPAGDVLLYIYHTNRKGIYETIGGEQGWARRHGIYRGWIRTGKNGQYTFYTFRPASYPDGREPEHIHITVKEPDKNEYYIDEFVFDDDPILTKSKRQGLENRCGSGIVKPRLENEIFIIERDLILGLNVPNYK